MAAEQRELRACGKHGVPSAPRCYGSLTGRRTIPVQQSHNRGKPEWSHSISNSFGDSDLVSRHGQDKTDRARRVHWEETLCASEFIVRNQLRR
jgi:hypothetical protein